MPVTNKHLTPTTEHSLSTSFEYPVHPWDWKWRFRQYCQPCRDRIDKVRNLRAIIHKSLLLTR